MAKLHLCILTWKKWPVTSVMMPMSWSWGIGGTGTHKVCGSDVRDQPLDNWQARKAPDADHWRKKNSIWLGMTLFAPSTGSTCILRCGNENVNFPIDMQRMPWHRLMPISEKLYSGDAIRGIRSAQVHIAGVTTVCCGKWLVNCMEGHSRGTFRTFEVSQGWTKGQTCLCASNKLVVPLLVRFVVWHFYLIDSVFIARQKDQILWGVILVVRLGGRGTSKMPGHSPASGWCRIRCIMISSESLRIKGRSEGI